MFLSWQQAALSGPALEPERPGFFLYDPATNKDLITNTVVGSLSSGAAVDNTILIDGNPTLKFVNSSSSAIITFPTPWNIESMPNWTVEWSSRPAQMSTGYLTELFIDVNPTVNTPIGCRWTDGGYGNRNQFNFASWANANIWRPSATKNDVLGRTVRWAMVYTNNRITIYKDGVKQMLESGTGGGAGTQDYIPKTIVWSNKVRIMLGYFNSTNQSYLGNFGRIRISDFARYTTNYVPAPF